MAIFGFKTAAVCHVGLFMKSNFLAHCFVRNDVLHISAKSDTNILYVCWELSFIDIQNIVCAILVLEYTSLDGITGDFSNR